MIKSNRSRSVQLCKLIDRRKKARCPDNRSTKIYSKAASNRNCPEKGERDHAFPWAFPAFCISTSADNKCSCHRKMTKKKQCLYSLSRKCPLQNGLTVQSIHSPNQPDTVIHTLAAHVCHVCDGVPLYLVDSKLLTNIWLSREYSVRYSGARMSTSHLIAIFVIIMPQNDREIKLPAIYPEHPIL